MQFPNQIQIIIQHFVEISAFLTGFCQNHWQVQTDCTNIESPNKHRLVIVIGRFHAATFKPWRQEGTTAHRADNLSVFFIDTGYITVSCQAEPVRIHGFAGTQNPRFKNIFAAFSRTMQFFVIQKYDFREQHWFFETGFSLSAATHFKHCNRCHLCKTPCACTGGHCNKRIIPTAGTDSIEFILPALESLPEFIFNIFQCLFFGPFLC